MHVGETTAPRGKRGQRAVDVTTLPSKATADEVHQHIRRFLAGTHGMDATEVHQQDVLTDIEAILDNELIDGLEVLLRHYHYAAVDEGRDQARVNQVWPVQELVMKLRELQRAQLRDAMQFFATTKRS